MDVRTSTETTELESISEMCDSASKSESSNWLRACMMSSASAPTCFRQAHVEADAYRYIYKYILYIYTYIYIYI